MTWQKPAFVELCMNAEIGSYQEDTDPDRDPSPWLEQAPPQDARRRLRAEAEVSVPDVAHGA